MKKPIHTNIKKLRGNITQARFAALLGVKRSNYAAYEEGRSTPPLEVIDQLCDLYGVTFKELIGSDIFLPEDLEKKFMAKYAIAPDNIRQAIDLLLNGGK